MRPSRLLVAGAGALAVWLVSGAFAVVTSAANSPGVVVVGKSAPLPGKDDPNPGPLLPAPAPAPASAAQRKAAEAALEKRSSVYGANTYSTHRLPGFEAQASSYGYGSKGTGGDGDDDDDDDNDGGYGAGFSGSSNGGAHGHHSLSTFSSPGFGATGFGASGFGGGFDDPHLEDGKSLHHLHHHDHVVDHHVKHSSKALALKGLLVPLAGVALLGAAAALVSNPILLQLGVISGRRRRRALAGAARPRNPAPAHELQQRIAEIALLERFMAGQQQQRQRQRQQPERQLLANYLSCSGLAGGGPNATSAGCLERVTCELQHPDSDASQLEKHVMQIVVSEILANEYISEDIKRRVKAAAKIGREAGICSRFHCTNLEL